MQVEATTINQLLPQHFIYGLSPIINWLNQQGIDHKPFLERIHIAPARLLEARQTITLEQEISFLHDVYRTVNRPELGLLIGPGYRLSLFGILGLAAASSRNLLTAYQVFVDHAMMLWTHSHLSVHSDNGYACFEFEPYREFGDLLPFLVERDMSGLSVITADLLGQRLPLERIEVSYPQPDHHRLFESVSQCPVTFNTRHNRVIFKKHWLETPLPKADPVACQVFIRQCRENAEKLSHQASFAEQFRNLIINNDLTALTLQTVADRLNTTPRSIQRKLAAENTTFRSLTNDIRHNIAADYLGSTTLPIEKIAERMGFNDPSAFSNAFKRWNGHSPREYRNRIALLTHRGPGQ